MSDPVPSPKGWAQLLTALRESPGWLLAGIAVGLWAMLYALNGGYVDPGPFGEFYRLLILACAFVTSGLFLARLLQVSSEQLVRRRRAARDKKILAFGESLAPDYWVISKQADGRPLTQFLKTISIHNRSAHEVRLAGFALARPRFARRKVKHLQAHAESRQRSGTSTDPQAIAAYGTPGGLTAGATERIPPKVGRLVMFPSWLTHQVRPYFGAATRISIAMNLSL